MLIKFITLFTMIISTYSFQVEADIICDDENKVFKVCNNQIRIFENAIILSKKERKPLLLIFGDNQQCLSCSNFQESLERNNLDVSLNEKYIVAYIGMNIQHVEAPTGRKVFNINYEKSLNKIKYENKPLIALIDHGNNYALLKDGSSLFDSTDNSIELFQKNSKDPIETAEEIIDALATRLNKIIKKRYNYKFYSF